MTCFQRANRPSTLTLKPLSRCQGIGPFLQHAGRDRQKIEQAVIAKLEQEPGLGQLLNPKPDFSLATVQQQVHLKHKRKIVVLGMIIPKVIGRIIIESDIVMYS
jgi:hypothetical protein